MAWVVIACIFVDYKAGIFNFQRYDSKFGNFFLWMFLMWICFFAFKISPIWNRNSGAGKSFSFPIIRVHSKKIVPTNLH